MADGTFESNQAGGGDSRFEGRGDGGEGRFRGGRGRGEGGNREAGGFRIRLSDNEMRAARAVQEAFGLRSTVAALGLSIRTVAQLLEEGKLEEVLAQHRANGGGRPSGGERRGGGRPERSERGGERGQARPNPFARPARPAAAAPAAVAEEAPAAEADIAASSDATEVADASSEQPAEASEG